MLVHSCYLVISIVFCILLFLSIQTTKDFPTQHIFLSLSPNIYLERTETSHIIDYCMILEFRNLNYPLSLILSKKYATEQWSTKCLNTLLHLCTSHTNEEIDTNLVLMQDNLRLIKSRRLQQIQIKDCSNFKIKHFSEPNYIFLVSIRVSSAPDHKYSSSHGK